MNKVQLVKKCHEMIVRPYSEGGISSYNEYNQFLCDLLEEGKFLEYLSVDGLKYLKKQMQKIYDSMPENDKW